MVMTRGWFMALFYPYRECLQHMQIVGPPSAKVLWRKPLLPLHWRTMVNVDGAGMWGLLGTKGVVTRSNVQRRWN